MSVDRVVVLVRHGVMPLELGLVHQLFHQVGRRRHGPGYEVRSCALEPGPIRTDADFTVEVTASCEVLDNAHTVIVLASKEQDETFTGPGTLPADLAAALERIPATARVASVCTGAFVLAAAGLLDGCRATTHWRCAPLLQRSFPAVRVDPDVLYTKDGRVLTSAGEAAGIDLCLHMIRQDRGAAVANAVARDTVVPPHRAGGQAQFIPAPVPDSDRAASTAGARAWALEHLDQPANLHELASREAMSVRTFTRRFRAEVGQSPTQWLLHRRLDRARELLETTDAPVEQIARLTGFANPVSLRQHLRDTLGITPTAYRATFRGAHNDPLQRSG